MTLQRLLRPSIAFISLLALVWASACGGGGSSSPSGPTGSSSSSGASLTGSWVGTASDSTGPGQMTWQLTQSGGSFTGTATLTDTATKLNGRGSVSGTIAGSAIHFTMVIPAGGFDAPFANCTADASGDGQVSGTAMTATYLGSSSCGGTIASGELTLNKQ